jgi:hypothetical protein
VREQAKFVEKASGELVCASELLDPRNEVLRELFDDDPDAFPPGEFAKPEWLEVRRRHHDTSNPGTIRADHLHASVSS